MKASCTCSPTAEVTWNGNNKPVSVVEPTDLATGANIADGIFATPKDKKNAAARKKAREAATASQSDQPGTQSNDIHGSSTDSPRAAEDGRWCSQLSDEDAIGGEHKPKPTGGESAEEDDDGASSEYSCASSSMQEAEFLGELRKSRE